ncbi:MAG: alpha/beta hydrolase [Caldimonas sp.]
MTEVVLPPLLAPLEGRVPEAPAWFSNALAHRPGRAWHDVHGVPIETLTWGEIGRPGLLLLHGKMAHADWWSFIAPFFAATHRVVALSWAGMGGSGWRERYSVETMAEEAMAIADVTGLLDHARKPVVVAHSFGGFASLLCAERHGEQLGGVLTLDMPLLSREQREARRTPRLRNAIAQRPTRVYPDLPSAIARFRFAPDQPCENLFIADHIARTSLKPATQDGNVGWTWRFDPKVALTHPGDAAASLRAATCPVAMAWGADSALVTPEVAAHGLEVAGPGTPRIEIPAARHHVMVDQPLALVSALRGLLEAWPAPR